MYHHVMFSWKTLLKRGALAAGSIAGALVFIVAPVGAQAVGFPNSPQDCDDNAVIRCGALTAAALVQAYNADSYTQKVYQNFNILNSDIQNLPTNAVAGTVTKSGDVMIGSKLVANGALTAGRTDMPGSTKVVTQGITLYKRPTSVSFQQASLDAYVVMSNNQFKFAVLASCGNPVSAKPVVPPPAPQPKPQATAQCTSLTLDKVDTRQYKATVAFTTTGGATLKSITYDFGDNTTIPPTTEISQTHTYQRDGNFTVSATLAFNSSNTQPLNATCQQMITVSTPPAPTPPAPSPPVNPVSTPPKALPSTGPGGLAGIFLGTSTLGTLGFRAFLRRRLSN